MGSIPIPRRTIFRNAAGTPWWARAAGYSPINQQYERMLDEGEYLVCIGGRETCAGITVGDAVVTVHARYVYGPPSLVVFEPGSSEPRADRIFELGAN